jgi:hypothetical protein
MSEGAMNSKWDQVGVEPSLSEILDDPIVQTIMRYDRIGPDDVRAAMRDACRRHVSSPAPGSTILLPGVAAA